MHRRRRLTARLMLATAFCLAASAALPSAGFASAFQGTAGDAVFEPAAAAGIAPAAVNTETGLPEVRDISGAGSGGETAWLAGDGGLLAQTRDGGATWLSQESGTAEDLLAVSAADSATAWAAGRRGTVLRTTDGGITWQALDAGTGHDILDVSAVGPSTLWAVAEGPAVLRTTDSGATWQHLEAEAVGANRLPRIEALDESSAWAAGENGTVVRISGVSGQGEDAGATWEVQTTGTGDHLVSFSVVGGETAWAVSETGMAVRTGDGGASWTSLDTGAGSVLRAVFAVDGDSAWAAGSSGLLLRTDDAGASWARQEAGMTGEILALWASRATDAGAPGTGCAWAAGSAGMILRTSDSGATWHPQRLGTGSGLNAASSPGGGCAWTVGDAGSVLRTIDGGYTWGTSYAGTARDLNGVAAAGPESAWAVGAEGTVLHTYNGGRSWEEQPSRTTEDLRAASCVDASTAWVVGRRGFIARTFDEGQTWYPQSWSYKDSFEKEDGSRGGPGETELAGVYAVNADTAWAAGRGGVILKTTDAGETWVQLDSGTTTDLAAVCGVKGDPGSAWAAGADGTVLVTTDGGATWQARAARDAGGGGDLTGIWCDGAGGAWVSGEGGFAARTRDGGLTWEAQATGTVYDLNAVACADTDTAWVVGARGSILHYRSSPRLDSVNPVPVKAGTTVTLCGLAFGDGEPGSCVNFGTVRAEEYQLWSDRLIKVKVPAGASVREEVSVTTPRGVSAGPLVSIIPAVNRVSPTSSRVGDTMTVSGASFGGARNDSYVSLGAAKISAYTTWGNNVIRFKVPGGIPAAAEVKVTTASGTSNGISVRVSAAAAASSSSSKETAAPRIDLVDPPSALTGSEVGIYGTGFGAERGSSVASFGKTPAAAYALWSDELIVALVPAGAYGKSPVTVKTSAGTSNAAAFNALMAPVISSVSPASAPVGATVEITGQAFGPREGPGSYVIFGGVKPSSYDYWSETRIVMKVPEGIAGAGVVKVAVTTPCGTSATASFTVRKFHLMGVGAAGSGGGGSGSATAWAVGEGGLIQRTADGGGSWMAQDSGVTLQLNAVAAASASVAWAVGEGGVILGTADGGVTWTRHPAGAVATLYGVDAASASVAWAVGDGGVILRTPDGGLTWTAQQAQPGGSGAALYGVSAVSGSVAWAVGAGGVILRTADGGVTWAAQNSRVTTALRGICAVDASTAWAVGDGGVILRTADGGLTWTAQQAQPGGSAGVAITAALYGVAATSTGTVAWAVGAGGTALKTVDAGLTWTACAAGSASLFGVTLTNGSALAVGASGAVKTLP